MQCHPLANIRSHQLHVLILQAIKNWGRGRPGNVQYFDSLIALIVSEGREGEGIRVGTGFVCANISAACPFKGCT